MPSNLQGRPPDEEWNISGFQLYVNRGYFWFTGFGMRKWKIEDPSSAKPIMQISTEKNVE